MESHREIYLDQNATTRLLPEVAEVVERQMRESFANPGSRHAEGRRARRVLEDSRELIAAILGADPDEVIFTSGGTESGNLAIMGFAELFPNEPGTIALTAGEHPATKETCDALFRRGWRQHELTVDGNGLLRPEQFDQLPWDRLRLVAAILAHNETGVIQDLSLLAAMCSEHRIPIFVDALQAVGKVPVNFHELGAAAMSIGAHKFHGPRGIGALLLRTGWKWVSSTYGGHQERDRRPGTEPVPLIAGMARALELWHAEGESRQRRLAEMRDRLERELCRRSGPAVVNAQAAPRLPNTLSISFPGVDGEALLVALDLEGVACSLGSTCASGSAEPAPVLAAMGCSADVARSTIRFSVGSDNDLAEIDEAVERIVRVVERLRTTAAAPTTVNQH